MCMLCVKYDFFFFSFLASISFIFYLKFDLPFSLKKKLDLPFTYKFFEGSTINHIDKIVYVESKLENYSRQKWQSMLSLEVDFNNHHFSN